MTKCETAPVNAVNVIINTLVPTAVFNSYPKTLVNTKSIIIPPPAPTKPQIKPTTQPEMIDCIVLLVFDTFCIASLVVIIGFMINLIPRKAVIITEKPFIVEFGKKLET